MVKLWSKNKSFPLRTLAEIPVQNRLDTFELQIKFEHWVKNFPHINEMYQDKGLEISFEEQKLLVQTRMSDKQWTLWLLQHPNTPANNWVTVL